MMRQQRTVAVATVLVGLWFSAETAAENTVGSFRVEQAEIDVGTVVAGATATATFVFHNDGPDDVHIIRAKPS